MFNRKYLDDVRRPAVSQEVCFRKSMGKSISSISQQKLERAGRSIANLKPRGTLQMIEANISILCDTFELPCSIISIIDICEWRADMCQLWRVQCSTSTAFCTMISIPSERTVTFWSSHTHSAQAINLLAQLSAPCAW